MCAPRASASTSSGSSYSRSIRSRTRRSHARSRRCCAASDLLVTCGIVPQTTGCGAGRTSRPGESAPIPSGESQRMTPLASGCPRGPRSGADVGREMLAGEGGTGGDEVGGRALEDDPAAVVAGAGAEVDDPVGVRHDRLVVLDDDDRLAAVHQPVEQGEHVVDVGEVEARGWLVEHVDPALDAHLDRQLEPLPLTTCLLYTSDAADE